jgi:hypothetical protein
MARYIPFLIAAVLISSAASAQTPPPQTPGAINSSPPIGSSKGTDASMQSPEVKDQAKATGDREPASPVVVKEPDKAKTDETKTAEATPARPLTPEQKKTCEDSTLKSRNEACAETQKQKR